MLAASGRGERRGSEGEEAVARVAGPDTDPRCRCGGGAPMRPCADPRCRCSGAPVRVERLFETLAVPQWWPWSAALTMLVKVGARARSSGFWLEPDGLESLSRCRSAVGQLLRLAVGGCGRGLRLRGQVEADGAGVAAAAHRRRGGACRETAARGEEGLPAWRCCGAVVDEMGWIRWDPMNRGCKWRVPLQ